jgi:transposase InsO family protein
MVPFFQGLMETILEPCLHYCLVYLDDIVVYTIPLPGMEPEAWILQHAYDLVAVITLLTRHSIRLNLKKCHIGYQRLRVLGHVLTGEHRSVDPEKLTTLNNFPKPTTGKQIMSFLGFVNYLRDYIPLYSTLAAPLEALRNEKNIEGAWSRDPRCEYSFKAFLTVLQNAPVIHFPVPGVPFRVYTDASDCGIGAVLSQMVDEKEQYVSFVAKSLNPAQRNYSATKRECLAIVFALQRFREYLLLSHFELFTDHRALTFMFTQKHLNPMLMEWVDTLLDYDFAVTHLPGVQNVLADALSRSYPAFVWEERGADANLSASRSAASIKTVAVIRVDEDEKVEQKERPLIKVEEVVNYPTAELATVINQRLDKKLPELADRLKLLEQIHTKGHFGSEHMFKQLWQDGYYWPTMKVDCVEMVCKCAQCLRYNIGKRGFHPQKSIQAELPFDHVAVDNFKMESTSPRGYNYVLTMVDLATRFVFLAPLENERASTIARRLWEWFCMFGMPKIIQSDNGTAFVNKVVGKMMKLMGVDHRLIAAYNPRANGAAERHVQTAKATLLKYCEGNVVNFDLFLPAVQFAINTKTASLHRSSPFALMFARGANPLKDFSEAKEALLTPEQLLERNKVMLDIIYPTVETAVASTLSKRDKAADASRSLLKEDLPNGAQVMIKDLLRSKAEPRWVGPYRVLSKVGTASYRLQEPTGEEFQRLVPVDQIKVVSAEPQDEVVEPTFFVERIVNHRVNPETRATEYFVKWKHYPTSQNTWEPLTSFDDNEMIRRYWAVRESSASDIGLAAKSKKGRKTNARNKRAAKDKAALLVPEPSDEDSD